MTYDIVSIGAGTAGEYAAGISSRLGGRMALVERELVGGECPFWACMPSKTLLDSAQRRHLGADYPWRRASDRRDWMISREATDWPDDSGHVEGLRSNGAELFRGEGRIVGSGRVTVRAVNGETTALETRNVLVATGSEPIIPSVEGLEESGYWTSREATVTRELPSSLVVLGSGVVGIELAQAFARFGTRVTIVELLDRVLAKEHPRSSATIDARLREEGVEVRTGVTAASVERGGEGRIVGLSDGSRVQGAELLVAIGRRPPDMRALGLEEAEVAVGDDGTPPEPDETMRIGDRLFVAGDAAGGSQFTHVAAYEGQVAARVALGEDVRTDLTAVPKVAFTDPEVVSVGLTVEEAQERGIDAFEASLDFSRTSRGFAIEGAVGHLTAVVDRDRRVLVGAFAAAPGAAELIHELVLAIKQGIPLHVLTDTIHAFPTGAREFWHVLEDAERRLH